MPMMWDPKPEARRGVPLRLIVCGSSTYTNVSRAVAVLDKLHRSRFIEVLIHRQETGLDLILIDWARPKSVQLLAVPLMAKRHREKARGHQSAEMFSHRPHGVLAFPGDFATLEILAMAIEMRVPVWQPYGP